MTRPGIAECLWVGAGGMLGSVLRFVLHTSLQRITTGAFPWGTLAVNGLGCLAIGLVAGWPGARDVTGETAKLFLVIGLFGGFTTFSTFGVDTFDLLRGGSYALAATNAAAQVTVGLLAVGTGFAVGRAF